jgi:hypothetical protein
MNNQKYNYLGIAIVALIIGYSFGGQHFNLKSTEEKSNMGMHTEGMKMDHMDNHSKHLNITKGYAEPTVKLTALKDTMGGYNLQIQTTNYKFTPEKAGDSVTPTNTGHAHVYINGTKIGRYYGGGWIYVAGDKFKNGTNTIEVSLNTNDHNEWYSSDDQRKIEGKLEILVNPTNTMSMQPTKTFELVVQNKKVISGGDTIKVMQGENVSIKITVDEDEELHLHGYNKMVNIEKGKPAMLEFVADKSGRFPYELEKSGTELGNLEVQPK